MATSLLIRTLGLCGLLLCIYRCAPLEVRSCATDADCQGDGAAIFCLDQKCNAAQCNKGTKTTCYDGPAETLGLGWCRGGYRYCLDTGRWSPCQGQRLPVAEICDREDNDCDGEIDEDTSCKCQKGASQKCYAGPKETAGKGTCLAGLQYCGVNNLWGPCLNQVLPQSEKCDGLDNNCNGQTDDGIACDCEPGVQIPCYSGDPQTLITGEISTAPCREGLRTCTNERTWSSCQGEVLPTPKERCGDAIDDNCNGQIDEGCSTDTCQKGTLRPCDTGNKGPCGPGTEACTAGEWGPCQPNIAPLPETCDGKDNDCNGTIDDKITPRACQTTCGPGTESCSGGTWGKCQSNISSSPEVCDGKDNDCNGQVDDNIKPRTCQTTCGQGTEACTTGTWGPCKPTQPPQEVCDGKDNNCDGTIDEGCLCGSCKTSADCKQPGTNVCTPDGCFPECTQGSCPKPFSCGTTGVQKGICQPPGGSGQIWGCEALLQYEKPCGADTDCGQGAAVSCRYQVKTMQKQCTIACTNDNQCPKGHDCSEITSWCEVN